MAKRLVVVGGVAAGASAAAKARRVSEDIEIVLVEAGPYISFANCGLPYFIGGEIDRRESLLVVPAELFARRFNAVVRPSTRVTAIDRQKRAVSLALPDGGSGQLTYDRLVLATGGVDMTPPITGLPRDNVFTVRSIPDVDAITAFLEKAGTKPARPLEALVAGGGYIGLESAEQLRRRGLKVTVVQRGSQLMSTMDREMVQPLHDALLRCGCGVLMGQAVSEIIDRDGRSVALTTVGTEVPFDLAILGVGVRPNVELAQAAGLVIGQSGAIKVDRYQRTSDSLIYAAGDNSQVRHLVLGRGVNIPLAGAANKAGRAAGANAALDLLGASDDDRRRIHLSGVLGTAIVRVGDTVAGVTGLTAKQARREGLDFDVVYLPGHSHASYYPGAERLLLKIVYSAGDGRIFGAQAVGGDGVDKRLDVLATAIVGGLTVEDLEQLDLCYAPPFGSAKDVAIVAGFAAANERRGWMPSITPDELLDELAGENPPAVLDVRTPEEFAAGHLDGAVNIPIDDLRRRISEVPADRQVAVHCAAGYRGYLAQRILLNRGYRDVRNILGGYDLIRQVQRARG